MRILFQMPRPVYLRMYGSTIRLLADRGHEVLVSYDRPPKSRDGAAVATIADHERIRVVKRLPEPSRRLEPAVGQLRAAIDYLRYLDRRFAGAPYLRRRLDEHLRGPARLLARVPYGLPGARPLLRALLALERRVPSDPRIEQAIAAHAPDALVLTPLLGRSRRNRRQTDTVKAARALGIPVAAGVASWDHLTTKGLVKALPDRLFVWNEIQRREAQEFHDVPPERVVVTGAQLFDRCFDHEPAVSRDEFLRGVGLPPDRDYVLYAGSSPHIAEPHDELAFVRRWLRALRESGDPLLAPLGVLVRPHPHSVPDWAGVDLADLGGAVAPRERPSFPMTDEEDAFYLDSIHWSSAVVGINTSAMVEAFARRRPVLTVRTPEFRETQEGTLHFQHLLGAAGGALPTASSLDEHLAQLRRVVEAPDRSLPAIEEFLRAFVRPHGLDVAATPLLADAIEQLAGRASSADAAAPAAALA